MINKFINLYNGLTVSELVLFWVFIFFFLFLVFLSINLIKKNKELLNLLNKEIEKNNTLTIEHNKIIELYNKEKSAQNEQIKEATLTIEQPKEEYNLSQKEEKLEKEEELPILNFKIEEQENKEVSSTPKQEEKTLPYQGNHLRSGERRFQTSPISIAKEDMFNLNEISLPIEEQNNVSYIEEVSKKMNEEIVPQTIELTDYEKKQEEEAIISYKELLDAKDRLYNITDDEEIDSFIDNLKEFRASLEP